MVGLFSLQQKLKQKEHIHSPSNRINQTVFFFLYYLSGLFVFRFLAQQLKNHHKSLGKLFNSLIPQFPHLWEWKKWVPFS